MIHFCFDTLGTTPRLGYPNLAQPNLAPDEFDVTWPRSIPLRLLMYFERAGIEFRCHQTESAPLYSWYPIALGWNDHTIDYFDLVPANTMAAIKSGTIRILFYYHEGDDPHVIKQILDQRAAIHGITSDRYLFISANTAADDLQNFRYFDDHEYFFRYVNRHQRSALVDDQERSHRFSALNRTHKWWRASVMSDLYNMGVLEQSLWSYNIHYQSGDQEINNPLELDTRKTWRQEIKKFLADGPYFCDTFNATQHNDHRLIETNLYLRSYFHIIIETHFDADGSGGAFLTEKTYKCIKYGQPFVIVGTRGSLEVLRQHGYRVFDTVLDNRYDTIAHNTQRWAQLRLMLQDLARQDLHQRYLDCLADVQHNQRWFQTRQCGRDLQDLATALST